MQAGSPLPSIIGRGEYYNSEIDEDLFNFAYDNEGFEKTNSETSSQASSQNGAKSAVNCAEDAFSTPQISRRRKISRALFSRAEVCGGKSSLTTCTRLVRRSTRRIAANCCVYGDNGSQSSRSAYHRDDLVEPRIIYSHVLKNYDLGYPIPDCAEESDENRETSN